MERQGIEQLQLAGIEVQFGSQWAVASTATCRCARGCTHQRRAPLLPPVPSTTAAPQAEGLFAGRAAASNRGLFGAAIAVVCSRASKARSGRGRQVRRSPPSATRAAAGSHRGLPHLLRDRWQTARPSGCHPGARPGAQGRRAFCLQRCQMLHETLADAGFKGRADHLARQARLQLLEQGPGITLLQGPAHQPAGPALALLRQQWGSDSSSATGSRAPRRASSGSSRGATAAPTTAAAVPPPGDPPSGAPWPDPAAIGIQP